MDKKRGLIFLMLGLLVIFSLIIAFSENTEAATRGSVVEGVSRGSVEVFTRGEGVRDAIGESSNYLDSAKKIIEECKQLEKSGRKTPSGVLGTYNPKVGQFKRYTQKSTWTYFYDCKKGVKLHLLDRANKDDIYTTRKIDLTHSRIGTVETFYDLNTAQLIGDKYYVDIHYEIEGKFWKINNQELLKNSLETGELTKKERDDLTLKIVESINKDQQFASTKEGFSIKAKGEVKAAVPGEQRRIFFGLIPLNDWFASRLYHPERFYYDEEGDVVFECSKVYCKSDGFKAKRVAGQGVIRDEEDRQMELKFGRWIPIR